MSKEAIQHYESALKEAFPSGATGDVFFHWNEARKALAEQPAQPLTDEQMFKFAEIAWRHGWASCRDAEYVGEESEDERWGMVGSEVVQDIAAHGITKGNT